MSWNYRLLRDKNGFYHIHEVYYYKNGYPSKMSVKPVEVSENTLEGMTWVLEKVLEGIEKKGIFVPPKHWNV